MQSLRTRITAEIPHLRRYARALAGCPEEADDLVQGCLERALKNAQKWDPEKGLRSWLFRILHNNHVSRRRSVDRELSFRRHFREPDSVAAGQEVSTELDGVRAAMAELPEEHRNALLLVAVEGFTYEEASEVLSVPVGTLRSRLSRAREALRAKTNGATAETVERGAE
ncbi:sigma-70 family RNA polymerase sigma factor [Aquisalimonas asiatica]|uniref:RNA polymerase sigma-70 factor, ECF subfamily n=1 Tax=Aquisalimonas asiatica TaxID=406100 RepID=A0A1H8QXQ7_9GAMM|nr:sigma-70 family RNA polymerase sigma factor [Aquisalimonas asiatica]SEO58781.1 RNA polymerase sigma-70 factor, ECF subfamily [Aquisalimonas asiatica]